MSDGDKQIAVVYGQSDAWQWSLKGNMCLRNEKWTKKKGGGGG